MFNIVLIIDRFESRYNILESQEKPIVHNFPNYLLPSDAKEGSVLSFNIDAYFGNIRTLFPVTSGQHSGIIRTA